MKTFKNFRADIQEAMKRMPTPEQQRERMQRRAARKQASMKAAQMRKLNNEVELDAEMVEEAEPVEIKAKDDATANMKEPSEKGDAESPMQGSSEKPKLTHMCATKVVHKKYGEGKPLFGEHAEPNAYGQVEWYKVMFEHGIETIKTRDMEVLEEGSHGNHKKK